MILDKVKITKNKRIGGFDIEVNGIEIWIAGSKKDAENEVKIELRRQRIEAEKLNDILHKGA